LNYTRKPKHNALHGWLVVVEKRGGLGNNFEKNFVSSEASFAA